MKKFVICNRGHHVLLTPTHVAWLHANGHPEADVHFGDNDRSNPDLIACIEAIRASRQNDICHAEKLLARYNQLRQDNEPAFAALSVETDKLLDMLEYRRYVKPRIIAEIRKAVESNNWNGVTIWAGPKDGVSDQAVKTKLTEVANAMREYGPQFKAVDEALGAYKAYCDLCSLEVQRNGKIVVVDGFTIESYDETRFTAAVRYHYGEYIHDKDYEYMELKPFLTRETVAAFVDAGDTDGLMAHLKSLNVNGFMEIRDHRTNVTSITDSEWPEDMAEFEAALMASIAVQGDET